MICQSNSNIYRTSNIHRPVTLQIIEYTPTSPLSASLAAFRFSVRSKFLNCLTRGKESVEELDDLEELDELVEVVEEVEVVVEVVEGVEVVEVVEVVEGVKVVVVVVVVEGVEV